MPEGFKRRIYLLRPGNLTPETIAVTFAKTSRSPLSFREIAEELSEEASASFHEKWVVGYGHASVAEHAVLHIAFENVSRLAVECIESNRLASYTEKSTRYQTWDPKGYHVPAEVRGSPYEGLYIETCDRLFQAYHESLEPVRARVAQDFPRREGESKDAWDGRIRSHYVDVCRFFLPAAALANLGMTANARALEHSIRKMLSHPLAEVREIGEQVKRVAQDETPTLVKYADPVPYLKETEADLASRAGRLPAEPAGEMLRLIEWSPRAEAQVLAAGLFAQAGCSYETALATVEGMDDAGRAALAQAMLGRLGRFDVPLRALEHAFYSFEAVMDQGAYFELKRHRMMTQTPQRLQAGLGYAVPRLFAEAGVEASFRKAMAQAAEAYERLAAWNPHVAAYVVPNAFNRRVVMTLNLREAYHFCELRAAANAHFSIRRIALRMAEMIREVHPLLSSYMRLPEGVDWHDIERAHFGQV